MKLIKRIQNGNRYSNSRFERVQFPRPLQRETHNQLKFNQLKPASRFTMRPNFLNNNGPNNTHTYKLILILLFKYIRNCCR